MKDKILKSVKLTNFRVHESYRLVFDEKITSILGKNGCGKTSVLEAIYIALRGKSFRAVDRDILKYETNHYKVEVDFENGEKTIVIYDGEKLKKQFFIQDKKFIRLPKKYKYPTILFLPEDLHLVSSSPTTKREYFDRLLSQIDEQYSNSLSRYNKALKQRNELLKQEHVDAKMLFSWDVMLANYGVYIREKRNEIVGKINQQLTRAYRDVSNVNDSVKIEYKSNTGDVPVDKYMKLLEMDNDRDITTGHTNFGVHRDDYEFIFNKSSANGSASRGETRSIIIALKFIEARLISKSSGKRPIVLLDDVFSELDNGRRKCLMDNFKENQVVLTSVEGA